MLTELLRVQIRVNVKIRYEKTLCLLEAECFLMINVQICFSQGIEVLK